ncbi:hypothetical protein FOL47_008839 [Perkinsus chesapeaki]|uniref:Uncharacterized protein n=1 Tax=Perkinsus chesapeaki TaxID=330153 RepID=A0A7J6LBH0_PERCH|nr:hypothetical protein FOL47_008839 [Perkinsus chesapeaki]
MLLPSSVVSLLLPLVLCHGLVFIHKNDSAGLAFPFAKSYTIVPSPTHRAAPIERLDFVNAGQITMVSAAGAMGSYQCRYSVFRKSGAPRVTVNLAEDCRVIVTDSAGYYATSLLTGITVSSDYQTFYMPLSGGQEDQYICDSCNPSMMNPPLRLTYPLQAAYVLNEGPTSEARIQKFDFTMEYHGLVYITSVSGKLPSGSYKCGYTAHQEGTTTITLSDYCLVIVTDSEGYYSNTFLTGITISADRKVLEVPLNSGCKDTYSLVPSVGLERRQRRSS